MDHYKGSGTRAMTKESILLIHYYSRYIPKHTVKTTLNAHETLANYSRHRCKCLRVFLIFKNDSTGFR